MTTSTISQEYANLSRRSHICDLDGGEKKNGSAHHSLPLRERYAEISRVLDPSFLSPYEMFGIVAFGNCAIFRKQSRRVGKWKRGH